MKTAMSSSETVGAMWKRRLRLIALCLRFFVTSLPFWLLVAFLWTEVSPLAAGALVAVWVALSFWFIFTIVLLTIDLVIFMVRGRVLVTAVLEILGDEMEKDRLITKRPLKPVHAIRDFRIRFAFFTNPITPLVISLSAFLRKQARAPSAHAVARDLRRASTQRFAADWNERVKKDNWRSGLPRVGGAA